MRQGKFLLVFCSLVGAAAGCLSRPAPTLPTAALATAVQATVSALGLGTQAEASAVSTSQPVLTATPLAIGLGSISGYLSYPSEAIPAERVIAFSTTSSAYFFVDTAAGSSIYKIPNVPSGTYNIVAYVAPSAPAGSPIGLSAGFSQAVLCGLVYGCQDHSLLPVVVRTGVDTPEINPQDWYAPQGSFPPLPKS
ncbi:MAG: hypothetical protein ABSG98_00965 [Anaerolineales bacterium]|jgi:hypothetical protein